MKVLAFVLVTACAVHIANAQAVIEPADQLVVLTGTIRMVHGYGAPGYGEDKKNDRQVSYLAIELPKPINIACTPQLPELASIQCGPAKRLRLFFFSASGDQLKLVALKMVGRKATLTGKLERRTSMAEMTPILIEVTAIEASFGGS
jgi:hypothetical protein